MCKRIKLDPYLTPFIKVNSKWTQDLNVRATTIKLLEENRHIGPHDLGSDHDFFNMTSKAQATKEKIGTSDFIKFKSFYASKEIIKKVKRLLMG